MGEGSPGKTNTSIKMDISGFEDSELFSIVKDLKDIDSELNDSKQAIYSERIAQNKQQLLEIQEEKEEAMEDFMSSWASKQKKELRKIKRHFDSQIPGKSEEEQIKIHEEKEQEMEKKRSELEQLKKTQIEEIKNQYKTKVAAILNTSNE